jgi:hypothetical protein
VAPSPRTTAAQLVEEIVRQLMPGHEVQNDIRVEELGETQGPERLR